MKKLAAAAIITVVLTGTIMAGAQSETKVYVNGGRINGDAFLIGDKTYIPLRAVSEAMGAEVSWDGESGTAYVNFSEDDAVPKLIETVSPSVVAIAGNYKPEYMSDSALKYNERMGHGAGVIIKSNGTILTNAHVVDELTNLTVLLNDGTSYAGQVLFTDETSDLAIVKIEKLGLRPIALGSKDEIKVGKSVVAIGTPVSLEMRNSATKGIISGSGVKVDSYYRLIQTDAAINPGNSGGALINMKGELIGINSSKYVSVGIEGIGFSIPIDTVKYILNQYDTNGKVLRPDMGITFEESWESRAGLVTDKGITIKRMSQSDTGLAVGDVVTAVNGIKVHSVVDWNEAIKDTFDGSSLTVTIARGGETQEITCQPALKN